MQELSLRPIKGAFFVPASGEEVPPPMPNFSQQLVLDTIACFKEEDGVQLTQEEAIEVLESFAGLYMAFAEGGAADPARLKAAEPPPDLISPHSCKEGFHS
ncbi:MAG: hypothetical protein WCW14_04160 [Candidatus Paceibacterota bacterium]